MYTVSHSSIINIAHPTSRFMELFCVLFGHQWDSHERESDSDGRTQMESNQCSRCKLAKRIVLIPTDNPGVRKRVAY
jgi:hypothetical protein